MAVPKEEAIIPKNKRRKKNKSNDVCRTAGTSPTLQSDRVSTLVVGNPSSTKKRRGKDKGAKASQHLLPADNNIFLSESGAVNAISEASYTSSKYNKANEAEPIRRISKPQEVQFSEIARSSTEAAVPSSDATAMSRSASALDTLAAFLRRPPLSAAEILARSTLASKDEEEEEEEEPQSPNNAPEQEYSRVNPKSKKRAERLGAHQERQTQPDPSLRRRLGQLEENQDAAVARQVRKEEKKRRRDARQQRRESKSARRAARALAKINHPMAGQEDRAGSEQEQGEMWRVQNERFQTSRPESPLQHRRLLLDEASDADPATFAMSEYQGSDSSDLDDTGLYFTELPTAPLLLPPASQKRLRRISMDEKAYQSTSNAMKNITVEPDSKSTRPRSLRPRVNGRATSTVLLSTRKRSLSSSPINSSSNNSGQEDAEEQAVQSEETQEADGGGPVEQNAKARGAGDPEKLSGQRDHIDIRTQTRRMPVVIPVAAAENEVQDEIDHFTADIPLPVHTKSPAQLDEAILPLIPAHIGLRKQRDIINAAANDEVERSNTPPEPVSSRLKPRENGTPSPRRSKVEVLVPVKKRISQSPEKGIALLLEPAHIPASPAVETAFKTSVLQSPHSLPSLTVSPEDYQTSPAFHRTDLQQNPSGKQGLSTFLAGLTDDEMEEASSTESESDNGDAGYLQDNLEPDSSARRGHRGHRNASSRQSSSSAGSESGIDEATQTENLYGSLSSGQHVDQVTTSRTSLLVPAVTVSRERTTPPLVSTISLLADPNGRTHDGQVVVASDHVHTLQPEAGGRPDLNIKASLTGVTPPSMAKAVESRPSVACPARSVNSGKPSGLFLATPSAEEAAHSGLGGINDAITGGSRSMVNHVQEESRDGMPSHREYAESPPDEDRIASYIVDAEDSKNSRSLSLLTPSVQQAVQPFSELTTALSPISTGDDSGTVAVAEAMRLDANDHLQGTQSVHDDSIDFMSKGPDCSVRDFCNESRTPFQASRDLLDSQDLLDDIRSLVQRAPSVADSADISVSL